MDGGKGGERAGGYGSMIGKDGGKGEVREKEWGKGGKEGGIRKGRGMKG